LFPVDFGVRRGEVPPVPKPALSDIVRTKREESLIGREVENEFVASLGMEMFTGMPKAGVMSSEYGGLPPLQSMVSESHARGVE
jgi:hypothetical protein